MLLGAWLASTNLPSQHIQPTQLSRMMDASIHHSIMMMKSPPLGVTIHVRKSGHCLHHATERMPGPPHVCRVPGSSQGWLLPAFNKALHLLTSKALLLGYHYCPTFTAQTPPALSHQHLSQQCQSLTLPP